MKTIAIQDIIPARFCFSAYLCNLKTSLVFCSLGEVEVVELSLKRY